MVREENQNIDEHPMATVRESDDRKLTISQWVEHCKDTYGVSALSLLTFVYFTMGFKVLFSLTIKDLF